MKLLLILTFVLFSSCSSHKLESYKDERPLISVEKFFNGNLYALGIVQDRSGKVIKRFKVDIQATWKNNTGTLDEKFIYSDGKKETRVWTLTKQEDNTYSGSAGDVNGLAIGKTEGNAFYFEYVLNLPVGDSIYKVKFEDWMYQLDDKTLLARSYMSKWGLNLGEVTIVMIKR
jgi:hypothetical protein